MAFPLLLLHFQLVSNPSIRSFTFLNPSLHFIYSDKSPETAKMIRQSAVKKYEELGSMTLETSIRLISPFVIKGFYFSTRSHEVGVLIHFIILILLWFFRYPGWANMISDNKSVSLLALRLTFLLMVIFLFWLTAN